MRPERQLLTCWPTPKPVVVAPTPKPVVVMESLPPAPKQSPPEIPTQMEPAAVAEPKPAPVETATVTSDPAPATEPPPTTDSGPDMMDKITEFFSSKPEETKPPPEMEQAAVPEPEPAPVSVPEPAPAPVETPIAKPEPLPPPQPVTATDSGSDMMDKITEFFSSRAEETKLPPETEQAAVPEPEPEPAPISVPEPAPARVKVPVAKPEPPPPHQPVPATGIAQATPVAAVAKAAAPKQRIDPVLGRSLRLGKPMAAAHAEGCLEEKPQLFWICIEPVDWPKEIAEVFQVRSSLYQGAQAIVRYEGGGVSQIHSLFPARFFDAVSAYFSGRLGIPGTQVDNWASMPGEPNSNNRTLLWLGPKAIILEIRQFDDLSRPSIPDTKHGVVRIYGLNSNPVLEDVSWSDFMLMRNSVQKTK